MAANLAKAGHRVRAFDLSTEALDKAVQAGCMKVETALEAIQGAEFIISMLPAGKHVHSLYVSCESPLFDHIPEGALVIDSSTIESDVARALSHTAKEKGIAFMDAPVSGGVGGAQAGTLAFMVGADKSEFDRALPILECMGKNIFHAGDHGAGQIAKACNNMMLAILMAGTCEALNMGMKNGLDPEVLSNIMKQSSGNNWALQVYNPVPGVMENVPAANGYQGGFMVDLMFKDLGLAMNLSQLSSAPTPMGSAARGLFNLHKEQGNGHLDFSSLINLYQEK